MGFPIENVNSCAISINIFCMDMSLCIVARVVFVFIEWS